MRIGAGSGGGAGAAAFTACGPVGGHRGVMITAEGGIAPASASDLAHFERVLGITQTAAAAAGDEALVRWGGEMRDPSLVGRFAAGPVWLGEAGALTQAPPETGFMQQLALFVPPDRLIVKIGEPVQLTATDG